jgi:DNA-binding transcriptional MerR regulator
MPIENEYTLQDLADLTGVTARTIRFYVAQGLLPSPGRVGPGVTYGPGHLARLRLIRQLQREHLPLAEIRSRLESLDDAAVVAIVEAPGTPGTLGSAADYIRGVLAKSRVSDMRAAYPLAAPARLMPAPMLREPSEPSEPSPHAASAPPLPESPAPDRSQWDRVVLVPDVELHVRRPLTRHLNKRVERLIAIARELLEEDPS